MASSAALADYRRFVGDPAATFPVQTALPTTDVAHHDPSPEE